MEKNTFGQRFRIAFGNAKNAEIARKMDVSEAAIKNYVAGRVPDAEKLLLIKALTNCNLDWLLTGAEQASLPAREPSLEDVFDRRMRDIVREEIANLRSEISEPEEDVTIEPAEMILAPVVAHIGPGVDPKEEIRKSLVSEDGLREMEKRLKPRRKTG